MALPAFIMSLLLGAILVWAIVDQPAPEKQVLTTGSTPPVRAAVPAPAPPVVQPVVRQAIQAIPPAPAPLPAPPPPPSAPVTANTPLALQPTQQATTAAPLSGAPGAPLQLGATRQLAPETAPAPVAPRPVQTSRITPAPSAADQPDIEGDAATAGAPVGGSYSIVLATVENEADARAQLVPLQKKFGAVLGARKLSYRRAKDGGNIVWRVRAGGLSQSDAQSLCGKISAAGGDCTPTPQ